MREISPAHNVSADDFIKMMPYEFRKIVEHIRNQKLSGIRQLPSTSLIDKSKLLNDDIRKSLIDKVAQLVDENLAGRSEMCEQFSLLLANGLNKLGLPAKAIVGDCIYFKDNIKIFAWRHSWVRIGNEIIDANVDILHENPCVPRTVTVNPYWGPITEIPSDRHLRQDHASKPCIDSDVDDIWWPDLEMWLDARVY
jgi:hypothetical protein